VLRRHQGGEQRGNDFATELHRRLGFTVSSGGALDGPLGMVSAPNGDLLAANGGNGNIVEITPFGRQVASPQIDPFGAGGDLFGLTIAPNGRGVLFVDDGDNTLKLFGPGSSGS
jgi:hypothetical protein